MSVTAAPVLTVAGLNLSPSGDGSGLVGIGELRINWGRSSVLEQPRPATAAVTVRDTTAGATFARRTDLIGQPVLLKWSTGGTVRGTNFRGRITDVSVSPRTAGGFEVAISASSAEAEMANYTVPEGTTWPAETIGDRMARVRALLPSTLLSGGFFVTSWADFGTVPGVPASIPDVLPCGSADVSGRSALELLGELSTSMHPVPLVYNPGGDSYAPALRRRFIPSGSAGVTMSAGLVADADRGGRYVATALPAVGGLPGLHLDAQQTGYAGSLDQPIDGRITRVELSYLEPTAGYAQRTVSIATAAGALESTIGRRVLSVSSIHSDGGNAVALARLYADIVDREASAPRLDALNYNTGREPLRDLDTAGVLLAGYERPVAAFLGRSWLTRLGQRPMYGFLGGSIRYRRGDWDLDLYPCPVVVDPSPTAWAPLPISRAASSAAVRLRDVDPSVTFGDTAFLDVGAGYTTTTMPAYRGNPS